ncbi:MAG: alpha-amylase [Prolixibacteraceae bacterium]|jgi:alpha-amylase|nr:alpha-amylase [Prolixibacteraceae bacterium]MBT6006379.1 alpha-amylase [Prolixibacteraceae bacterium]MBT6766884.1 alpha-amylase [Prolixibacteraceae bacterium]MBT6999926.1 alpha-amylase [Prolixibacteraceae bacterium]MBT7393590.1 alpha-amylase [Prolixibacteraceae bacterium]
MKSICLFFQVHQPFRHRGYRFFDIGNDNYYYDDYANETIMREVAQKSYLPTNKLLLKLADRLEGKFKVSFSITGLALEQFGLYAPEVIESFQKLAKTGCVEFLSETYSHSLSSLKDKDIFEKQVQLHDQRIFELFGHKPNVFRNTEMIYSDEIGAQIADMGYKAILTEGAKHILGWKSPNFVYVNAINPRLKVLMRNFKLSDDISFRFSNTNWSEYPLTPEKFVRWLENKNSKEEVVNLFLSYESFGERQVKESGIFDFLEKFPQIIIEDNKLKFATPSEVIDELQPISAVSVPHPISWADEERDLTAWLGNEMQKEAFDKLYKLKHRMEKCTDPKLNKDWNYLQVSDHFYYMSTKFFSDGDVHQSFNPFDSPYDAFINYMNVLSDFKIRLNSFVPENEIEHEIAALHKIIDEKEVKIRKLEADLIRVRKGKRENLRQRKIT